VLLGLFILWQLFFVLMTNALDFVDRSWVPLPAAAKLARNTLNGWERLSGQWQYWSLFSPDVGTTSRFATLELRWDDGTKVQLPSIFEPPQPPHYGWPPGPDDRFFNFEANICTRLHIAWDDDKLHEQTREHQEARHEALCRIQQPALAYLRWRLAHFQQEHPERPPPSEVVLSLHVYSPPPLGQLPWQWRGPVEQPLLRWRPATDSLEVYNPVTRQFEILRAFCLSSVLVRLQCG
jgi:hypothetical protein